MLRVHEHVRDEKLVLRSTSCGARAASALSLLALLVLSWAHAHRPTHALHCVRHARQHRTGNLEDIDCVLTVTVAREMARSADPWLGFLPLDEIAPWQEENEQFFEISNALLKVESLQGDHLAPGAASRARLGRDRGREPPAAALRRAPAAAGARVRYFDLHNASLGLGLAAAPPPPASGVPHDHHVHPVAYSVVLVDQVRREHVLHTFASPGPAVASLEAVVAHLRAARKSDSEVRLTLSYDGSASLHVYVVLAAALFLASLLAPAHEDARIDARAHVFAVTRRNVLGLATASRVVSLDHVVKVDVADHRVVALHGASHGVGRRGGGVTTHREYRLRLVLQSGVLPPSPRGGRAARGLALALSRCLRRFPRRPPSSVIELGLGPPVRDVKRLRPAADSANALLLSHARAGDLAELGAAVALDLDGPGGGGGGGGDGAPGDASLTVPAKRPAKNAGGAAPAGVCVVCLGRRATVVVFPCKHMSMCRECSEKVETCPICRAAVAETHVVYW